MILPAVLFSFLTALSDFKYWRTDDAPTDTNIKAAINAKKVSTDIKIISDCVNTVKSKNVGKNAI